MGRKVNPIGFRLGVIRDWQSKWYSEADYSDNVYEDYKLRKAIMEKYPDASISRIEIERNATKVSVLIHTARPGIVIGRSGQRVGEITAMLEKIIGKKVQVDAFEIRQPELDAYLVARSVADQIERRVAYRRAMKQAIFRTIQSGAKGMRIICSGRLGGAEIARTQMMHQGRVPLHTMRADIDYGFAEAATTMGKIGIKVWIYRGDILPEAKTVEAFDILASSETEAATEKVEGPAEDKKPARKKAEAKAEDAAAEAKPKTRRKTAVAKDAESADASAEAKPAKATKKAAPKAKAETAEAPAAEAKPKRATKKKEAEA
ncbi:MAG: 30S ribosomal protein S3 [Dehalococcoidales bacterium]|jgi:small subunit ribosomal protein S3|nr:30S ribosomal protein S3 [Dehalococcoidales bacterium]